MDRWPSHRLANSPIPLHHLRVKAAKPCVTEHSRCVFISSLFDSFSLPPPRGPHYAPWLSSLAAPVFRLGRWRARVSDFSFCNLLDFFSSQSWHECVQNRGSLITSLRDSEGCTFLCLEYQRRNLRLSGVVNLRMHNLIRLKEPFDGLFCSTIFSDHQDRARLFLFSFFSCSLSWDHTVGRNAA